MIKHLIIGTALLVTSAVFANPKAPTVTLENNTLYYTGELEQDAIAQLKRLYTKAKTKPTVVEIDSTGGVTDFGMDLGAFIADNSLDVRVLGMCFSSCANFVFPAGKTTYIGKNAFVGWHGDGTSSDIYSQIKYGIGPEQSLRTALIEMYDRMGQKYTEKELQRETATQLRYIDRQKAQEDTFYKKYNISPQLARYPHMTEAGRQDLENSPQNSMGWTYTPEVLKQLGVNLVLIDNTWVFDTDTYDKQKPHFMGATLHLIREIKQ